MQAQDLSAEDFGGAELEGCNENLVLTRPDLVRRMHADYFAAGADMVETDTFGGTPLVLAEYGLAEKAVEINRRAAEIAREAAATASTPGRLRFVAGSMGPTTKAMTVTGGVTFDEMIVHYRTQAIGLLSGGADVLLLETTQDTRNLKAGLIGVEQAFAEVGWRTPVMVSVTIEPMGTMLAGQGVEALYASVMHAPLLSVGINCATGPEFMTDHIRSLSAHREDPDVLLPERRPAGRRREVFRDAGVDLAGALALHGRGLGQHRRRLLRHDARPHPGARGGGRGPEAAPARDSHQDARLRHRPARGGRRQPSGPRRRADERPRQPQVQAARRRRRLRRRGRDRPRAGQERRPDHRRLPPGPGPRRGRRRQRVPRRARSGWSRCRSCSTRPTPGSSSWG